ncbi:MAG TPA: glycosyltransferase family 1 protein, partial [Cytophagales bacterium]|nr:glycosyltransferase family 1 protein [Cytophagales bacterium]
GLPLVAAKGGGALDLVRPNETGYLFETNSDAVEALTRLVEQPDLRNQLGQTGRKVAEQEFEIHRVAEQVRALYDEILPG